MPKKVDKFRHRVTLYTIQDAPDSHGGFTQIETVFATIWTSMRALSGGERERAGGLATENMFELETWYIPNTTPLLIAKIGTHVLDILDVDDVDFKHMFMTLTCKERKGT